MTTPTSGKPWSELTGTEKLSWLVYALDVAAERERKEREEDARIFLRSEQQRFESEYRSMEAEAKGRGLAMSSQDDYVSRRFAECYPRLCGPTEG